MLCGTAEAVPFVPSTQLETRCQPNSVRPSSLQTKKPATSSKSQLTSGKKSIEIEVFQIHSARFFRRNQRQSHPLGMRGSVRLGFQFTFERTDNELLNRNALRACDLFSFAINLVGQFDCRPHDPPFVYDTASPTHAFAVGVLCAPKLLSGRREGERPEHLRG